MEIIAGFYILHMYCQLPQFGVWQKLMQSFCFFISVLTENSPFDWCCTAFCCDRIFTNFVCSKFVNYCCLILRHSNPKNNTLCFEMMNINDNKNRNSDSCFYMSVSLFNLGHKFQDTLKQPSPIFFNLYLKLLEILLSQESSYFFLYPMPNLMAENCSVWTILMRVCFVMVTIIKLTQSDNR